MISHPLGRAINFFWLRIMLLLSEKRIVEGFELYAFSDASDFFEITPRALSFLKETDPRRYKRTRQYLSRIAYLRLGTDYFYPALSAFIVDSFPKDNPQFFAAQIVHETTHAYLESKGLRYTPKTRERHEMICLNQQKYFIKRAVLRNESLSEEERKEVLAQWDQWFQEELNSHWWEPHKMRLRQMDRLRDQLSQFKKLFRKGAISKDEMIPGSQGTGNK